MSNDETFFNESLRLTFNWWFILLIFKENLISKRVVNMIINFFETFFAETLSDEKMKNWKHKTHKCALGNVKMNKPISGNELCRPGRPAELPYARVKLHYIIHYINRYVVYITVYI